MRVQAPPPAALADRFSETNAPQHCPAPTASAGFLAAVLPLVAVKLGAQNGGAGLETWRLPGMGVGGGARAAFGVGCTPAFQPVPHRGRPEGCGSGGGPGAAGLSRAAAQVSPVVTATAAYENLCPQACHVGWLLSVPPVGSRGAHQLGSLCREAFSPGRVQAGGEQCLPWGSWAGRRPQLGRVLGGVEGK